ncbi:hypothetical protein LEP1GSC070_2574 [Leptospira santarosai str. AIM]|nr:hypothetical protein LEP1GSC070_2574 [Leptospira santarosai str. AIM]
MSFAPRLLAISLPMGRLIGARLETQRTLPRGAFRGSDSYNFV